MHKQLFDKQRLIQNLQKHTEKNAKSLDHVLNNATNQKFFEAQSVVAVVVAVVVVVVVVVP